MSRHDPHSNADLTQATIRHTCLDLTIDFDARHVRGTVRYTLDRPPAGPLDLDTRGLSIVSIESSGRSLRFELGDEDAILGTRLRLLDLNGATSFSIAFALSRDATALQWLDASRTRGGHHPYLYTQCQFLNARSVFPCQDTPSVRFTYDATLDIPAPLAGLMAAARDHDEQVGDRRRVRFHMPQPVPSYLFAFAVGNLRGKDVGPRTCVYTEPEGLDEAAWEFAQTEAMVLAAERLYGPYLWERFDLLVLPPSFPNGGMENPRLTFVSPTIIIGDRSLTDMIAHELAHSWTGNLVTNATWEDLWLNEGWTTYAERRILESLEGKHAAMLRAFSRRLLMIRHIEWLGWDSDPTRLKFSQAGVDPDEVLSQVPYEKGYSFLVRLERVVGRRTFDEFARQYIAENRFGTTTTEAFLERVRQKLPRAAAEVDLDGWAYQPGFPGDAPSFDTPLMAPVSNLLAEFQAGRMPTRAEVAKWNTTQKKLFLQFLPRAITPDQCRAVEQAFSINPSTAPILLGEFYEIGIRSGYREVLEPAKALISRVGRGLIIFPVFRAMLSSDWSRAEARPLLDQVRDRHHPTTIKLMEAMLADEAQ